MIDFYFDFSSPYGYLGAFQIENLARKYGVVVNWKPFMVGAVFKTTGNRPLLEQPVKGEYSKYDWARYAKILGVKWILPDPFPVTTVAAARGFYWLDRQDVGLAKRFASMAYEKYFGDGINIGSDESVADIAVSLGVERQDFLDAIRSDEVKQLLRDATDAAVKRGVFGSPFYFLGDEPFMGSDRMWMIEIFLQKQGINPK